MDREAYRCVVLQWVAEAGQQCTQAAPWVVHVVESDTSNARVRQYSANLESPLTGPSNFARRRTAISKVR